MNDRCAAGCGRYLGYIADEMNIGLHELGPLAMKSTKTVRDQLDLHRLRRRRAARAAGAGREARGHPRRAAPRHHPARDVASSRAPAASRDEFTFTGGVAKNEAAVRDLRELVRENYGERRPSTSTPTPSTRARSARAIFAWRAVGRKAAVARRRGRMTITVGHRHRLRRGQGRAVPRRAAARRDVARRGAASASAGAIRSSSRGRAFDEVLDEAGLRRDDVDYVATTGEGESVPFATGHFYSMTTHARGGALPDPRGARGARHRRAARPRHQHRRARQGAALQDDQPVRLRLRPVPREHRALPRRRRSRTSAPSPCQARRTREVSARSARCSPRPTSSTWCRAASPRADILKGIHLSMAARLAKLLKSIGSRAAWCCSPAASRSTPA